MKIKKFSIKNYKAIDSLSINLSYSINPIIGINESGKTTILQALLAFNKDKDRYNQGRHLEFQNKYDTNLTTGSVITASIVLTKKEIDNLITNLNIETGTNDFKKIKKFDENTVLELSRNLSTDRKPYNYENSSFTKPTTKKIEKFLVSNLPSILYFDDFSDRVPEEISFDENYISTGEVKNGRASDWNEIIEEIFKRNDQIEQTEDIKPLQKYMKIPEQDRKNDVLSDIEDVLNTEIIEEWKKIKKSGLSNLADDSDGLSLSLVNDGNVFRFKVKDKSHKGSKRTFNINERSKGFQWFFNYMIKLKFNPKYKLQSTDSLFLLDEPGSYLHSSAQSELLKELRKVSENNTIVFCTHSQFLLNPSLIKLGSIKITEKNKSHIVLQDYGDYKTKKDKGALSPVFQALRLNFANEFFGKLVITEGVTDYYIFELIKKYRNDISDDIKIIPGAGAGSSTTLISLSLPFSDNFLVIFDNDQAGKDAAKNYREEFGDSVEKHFHFYHQNEKKFLLENHFSSEDSKSLLALTKSKKIKKALPILYYDLDESEIKNFIENLNTETINKFKSTFDRVAKL